MTLQRSGAVLLLVSRLAAVALAAREPTRLEMLQGARRWPQEACFARQLTQADARLVGHGPSAGARGADQADQEQAAGFAADLARRHERVRAALLELGADPPLVREAERAARLESELAECRRALEAARDEAARRETERARDSGGARDASGGGGGASLAAVRADAARAEGGVGAASRLAAIHARVKQRELLARLRDGLVRAHGLTDEQPHQGGGAPPAPAAVAVA